MKNVCSWEQSIRLKETSLLRVKLSFSLFPARKTRAAKTHPPVRANVRAIRAKRWHSLTPCRIDLRLPSPSPSVCTDVRSYADVKTKFFRLDGLPKILRNGATLAHAFGAPGISAKKSGGSRFWIYNFDDVTWKPRITSPLKCDVHAGTVTNWVTL